MRLAEEYSAERRTNFPIEEVGLKAPRLPALYLPLTQSGDSCKGTQLGEAVTRHLQPESVANSEAPHTALENVLPQRGIIQSPRQDCRVVTECSTLS